MPQPTKGARLGGSPSHERLMLANLATALFTHGRISTTETKAKRLRPLAERLITKAKRGDLHNRRQVMRVIRDKDVVHRLFAEIGPFFADRNGGYTRITKTLPRKGDNAPMAVIELVWERTASSEAERATRSAARPAAPTPPARPAEPAPAEEPADVSEEPAAVSEESAAASEESAAASEESAAVSEEPAIPEEPVAADATTVEEAVAAEEGSATVAAEADAAADDGAEKP